MTHIESNFTLIYKITVPASIFIITHQGVGFFLGRLPGPESTPSPVNVKLHQLSPGPPWKHQPNEVRNPPINLHINHHKHESFLVILSIRNLYNIYIYTYYQISFWSSIVIHYKVSHFRSAALWMRMQAH